MKVYFNSFKYRQLFAQELYELRSCGEKPGFSDCSANFQRCVSVGFILGCPLHASYEFHHIKDSEGNWIYVKMFDPVEELALTWIKHRKPIKVSGLRTDQLEDVLSTVNVIVTECTICSSVVRTHISNLIKPPELERRGTIINGELWFPVSVCTTGCKDKEYYYIV